MKIIEELHKAQLKKIPQIHIGDTLKVSLKIVEGERERTQTFSGTLISRKGKGLTETITLRRISYGEGVERILLLHSPRIEKIEVEESGKGHVRRAKLYYLRKRIGREAEVIEAGSKEKLAAAQAAGLKPLKSAKPAVKAEASKAETKPKAKETKEVKEAKPAK